jgi:hypothetical protein
MRVSRLVVVVAAAALALPAGMASMAMADDAPAGGAVSSTPSAEQKTSPDRPGKPGGWLTDEQRSCMEQKGFGKPKFTPGERPERPSREEMQKRREERMKPPTREEMQKRHEEMQKRRDEMQKRRAERAEAAKACGLPERPQWRGGPEGHGKGGPGHMQRRGPQVTDEQRACMEKKGFGRPNGERPKERPTREEMAKKRSEFESAAKECGLQMPQRRGPGGPGASPQVAPTGMKA